MIKRGQVQMKTPTSEQDAGVPCCSGGGIRTRDLRVMSPVSYQLLHPAMLHPNVGDVTGGTK